MRKIDNFVHLHLHSDYSLLDGACKFDRLFKRLKETGMKAVALTDHGNMFGTVKFYKSAIESGIHPIIGCELYVAANSKTIKNDKNYHHIVLLVKDEEGYKNLMYLSSWGYLYGFYVKPKITEELLFEKSKGLIALTACLAGKIPSLLLEGKYEEAKKTALKYQEVFGKDNFYLEVQDHGLEEEKKVLPLFIKLSRETGIPLVATNDCHYVYPEDHTFHELLLCLQTGTTISDPNRFKFNTDQLYVKTPKEMKELFKNIPEATENTIKIAEICSKFKLPLGKKLIPHYTSPQGKTVKEYLDELVWKGFRERYPDEPKDAKERLKYELEIIDKMNFNTYFLIVWDFVNFAKKKGIPVGPGRGSAAGSMVAYCLGITKIDPLKYNLIFERFLNPERVTMPDIDIDFCQKRREEMIRYVKKKYGKDNVAAIAALGGMKTKAAIRDIGRVLEIPLSQINYICKEIDKLKKVSKFQDIFQSEEIKKLYESDPKIKQLLQNAEKLEGFVRHTSVHPAGILISDEPIVNHAPLFYGKETRGKGASKEDKIIATQYDMNSVEAVGLLKMDFLGLRTLTVLDECVKLIEKTRGEKIDLDKINFEDKAVFDFISEGNTKGIFQLEEEGMQQLVKALKPSNLEELSALLALYRPGPLANGFHVKYVNRKFKREKYNYPHPALKPILEPTYGLILYQEQVQKIANVLANYSLGEADILRRAMGKKKAELMEEQRTEFVKRAKKNGVDEKLAERIFESMAKFAAYGFNKSHSVAYAYLSYQTAYLKKYYLKEFLACQMTSLIGHPDKLKPYFSELKKFNIQLFPPDINKSFINFTVNPEGLRFGLSAIKGVGEKLAMEIVKEREKNGPFKDMIDFTWRMRNSSLNSRALEALIKAGAFDFTGINRGVLFHNATTLLERVNQRKKMEGAFKSANLLSLAKPGKSIEEFSYSFEDKGNWDKLTILNYEREVLDFYISHHPVLDYKKEIEKYTTISIKHLIDTQKEDEVIIGGWIFKVNEKKTSKGFTMANALLEDIEQDISLVFFPQTYEKYKKLLNKPRLVFVKGHLDQSARELFSQNGETEESEIDEENNATEFKSTKFIVSEIYTLETASELLNVMEIEIEETMLSEEFLMKLKKLIEKYKGDKILTINIKFENAFFMRIKLENRISLSEKLEKEVQRLLKCKVKYYIEL